LLAQKCTFNIGFQKNIPKSHEISLGKANIFEKLPYPTNCILQNMAFRDVVIGFSKKNYRFQMYNSFGTFPGKKNIPVQKLTQESYVAKDLKYSI
jgi:hypothetical protein